jgi:hypothetical protein
MKGNHGPSLRQYSGPVLDGPQRAPSRGMLYAVGFKKEDFQKSIVGIASMWSTGHPHSVEPFWEFIERFGSYSAALALFFVLLAQRSVRSLQNAGPLETKNVAR